MSDYATLKARYDAANQGHVLAFYPSLSPTEQSALLTQLSNINPERVNKFFDAAIKADEAAKNASADDIDSLPEEVVESFIPTPSTSSAVSEKAGKYRQEGLKAIAEGKVAVLLMAGGQGTRLGSADPKGCYDIQLPSHKSLFQIQAERIWRLQEVAKEAYPELAKGGKVKIMWYVMTSAPTHEKTRAFFGWGPNGEKLTDRVNFGLEDDQVVFFQQGVLPCLTPSGQILLESPSKVAVAPDGNGGLYAALRAPLTAAQNNLDSQGGVLSSLRTRDITHIHAYCVDNCLVRVADPVFIGACLARKSDCAAKTVPKTNPHESVGVVARRAGKYAVVEYSEITKEQAEKRVDGDPEGNLMFRAGNIVSHVYTREFLERTEEMESSLAHHIARKKIPSIPIVSSSDPASPTAAPSASPEYRTQTKQDGLKLELFVFDVFPHSSSFLVLEVPRKEEFSPLKNAPGAPAGDSPETSRRDLLEQQKRWLESVGAKVEEGVEVEISPLVTYAGEGLESVSGKILRKGGVVEKVDDFQALL